MICFRSNGRQDWVAHRFIEISETAAFGVGRALKEGLSESSRFVSSVMCFKRSGLGAKNEFGLRRGG